MRFVRSATEVGPAPPPEELLTSVAGTCGLWQICICVVSCVAFFMCGMDTNTLRHSLLPSNYTCSDGNKTCYDSNGTECKNFTFTNRPYGVITFTETLLIVCNNESKLFWVEIGHQIGEVIGPFLVGSVANKWGIRTSSVVFIPLQCLTGLLILNIQSVKILTLFLLLHTLFGSAMCMYTLIAVCDSTCNNLRTFTLGTLMISYYFSDAVFPIAMRMFSNIASVILLNSVIPLTLLIPLLYYKDSPNNICFLPDFTKAEEVVRYIANINKHPIPVDAKLRPVQLISDPDQPRSGSFFDAWKAKTTRKAFLGLLCLNFFFEYYVCIFSQLKQKINVNEYLTRLSDAIATVLALVVIHLIPHRVFIGIITFTKCACILFIYLLYVKKPEMLLLGQILFYIGGMVRAMCHLALQNVAVRMYPTERRIIHLGFYWTVGKLGYLLSYIIYFDPDPHKTQWTVFYFVLLLSPIVETLSCFVLWEVHKRELPDFLVDCIRFEKFYKPTRYYCIYDVPSEHEIEVKTLELGEFDKNTKGRTKGKNA